MTLLHWILSASGLILVVLALRALLGRRISAAMRYALWGVVLLRLLLPSAWFSPGVTVTLPEPPDLRVPMALPEPPGPQGLRVLPVPLAPLALPGPPALRAWPAPQVPRVPPALPAPPA